MNNKLTLKKFIMIHKNFRIRDFTKTIKNDTVKNTNLIGLELGIREGFNAINMLKNLNIEKLYLIDIDTSVITKKIYKYLHKVEIIEGSSIDCRIYNKFYDNFFDFIYIDTSHNYIDTIKELNIWYKKVKPSGFFGGHDFCSRYGVAKAVLEFVEINNLNLYGNIESVDWWIVKPEIVN